jgi:hypothetical protein
MSNYLPSLIINPSDPIFIGAVFGFLLSIPVALFLAYWISDVKNKLAVVLGAFVGSFVGLLGVLGWVDTLIFSTPLPRADGVSTFFSTILLCSVLGLVGAMLTDLFLGRRTAHAYQREV